ncbi:hypothetical protein [Nonomuraea typhae]|uniref:HAD family hydrolase n=1 Tax=Nonomuraea typhae TaxID=2603600 RepID=A0ABW7YYG0_9ACTN
MQRLVLFDLDNTLIDLDAAFVDWAHELAEAQGIGRRGAEWLITLDRNGLPHRQLFFTKVSCQPRPRSSGPATDNALRLPKTTSMQLKLHVSTRGERRRAGLVGVCPKRRFARNL